MATALVTGASGGIGLELARVLAAKGNNIVLVARSEDKLKEIADKMSAEYKVQVSYLAKDLSDIKQVQEVYDELKQKGVVINYLINNAGFGDYGFFTETDWAKELQMINLNITALTMLTKLYAKEMKQRGEGRILNLGSTGSFFSGPTMAVYYATKNYVLAFSEAVNNELKGTGVTVTCLCPGATESGFQAAADLGESKLVKDKKLPTSAEVAQFGYDAMMNGEAVAVHGFNNKMLVLAPRFLPRAVVVDMVRQAQGEPK